MTHQTRNFRIRLSAIVWAVLQTGSTIDAWIVSTPTTKCTSTPSGSTCQRLEKVRLDMSTFSPGAREEDEQDNFWGEDDLEVLQGDSTDFDDEDDAEEDWIPDGVKAQQRRPNKRKHLTPANEVISSAPEKAKHESETKVSSTPYTEEEESLITAMGGSQKPSPSRRRREDGFLGDCTLAEIATDYSVPVCYLADVLCMWGVPVPIDLHDRLGDMVTGEQAFALVEAVNSLDIGVLQDRYSNQNLLMVCEEWQIELKEAFEFALKEGWSLPFGVRTNLRVEQEEELLRVFSALYRG